MLTVYDDSKPCEMHHAVDFDGTLAVYPAPEGQTLGPPVPFMMERVREWLAKGETVKIFTARAGSPEQRGWVEAWLKEQGLPELEVTDRKDFGTMDIYDDRAVRVETNTGKLVVSVDRRRVS